jgi:hypothetical protein
MPGPQNKLLLALQSGLPNEIDWAFNKLVKLSVSSGTFHVGSVAGLLDAIMAHGDPFFSILRLNTALDNFETTLDPPKAHARNENKHIPHFQIFSTLTLKQTDELIERVLQVMHILRNFSHSDHHAKFFITQHSILTMLAKAIALPSHTYFIEIKIHSLDIFENLASVLHLRGKNDFYLACLRKMIFDNDKSLIIGALKSLARLCGNESNHPHLSDLEPTLLTRLYQLTLVGDDEIVYSTLDLLYTFSCLGAETISKMAQAAPTNIVKIMLSFLHLNKRSESTAVDGNLILNCFLFLLISFHIFF